MIAAIQKKRDQLAGIFFWSSSFGTYAKGPKTSTHLLTNEIICYKNLSSPYRLAAGCAVYAEIR
jgi:hypothetical protein